MSTDLDQETERLNTLLAQAEERFRACAYGVEAEVELGGLYSLAFTKEGADWILQIRSGTGKCHVLKGSRSMRVMAAAALGTLWEELGRKRRGVLAEVQSAVTLVESFLLFTGPEVHE